MYMCLRGVNESKNHSECSAGGVRALEYYSPGFNGHILVDTLLEKPFRHESVQGVITNTSEGVLSVLPQLRLQQYLNGHLEG